MTIPLWVSILVAIVSGIFGGIIGPFVADVLSKRRWRAQKKFELKYAAFESALNAISAWAADALDTKLQSEKVIYQGSVPVTNMRPETSQALEHSKGLIETWFTETVNSKYSEVLHSKISIESNPDTEFEEVRIAFILAAASELQLN
jgi:hypothetical protein